MESTKTVKKLKFNIFNIKSLISSKRKKVTKIKKDEKRFNFIISGKTKVKKKEKKIETGAQKSALKNIATTLLSKPKSIIDKFKEVFGILVLGVLVNNLPKLLKGLQKAFTAVGKFFEDNPWIGPAISKVFDIVVVGMKGILDLTKVLLPVIGGSFKLGLDTLRSAGKLIGETDKFLSSLSFDIFNLNKNSNENDKVNQELAEIDGKYYSNTTKKTYPSYSEALKDPEVKSAAIKPAKAKAQQKITAPAPTYNPETGTTTMNTPGATSGGLPMIIAPRKGVMGAMQKDKPESWSATTDEFNAGKNVERYNALKDLEKIQSFSVGGTVSTQKMTVKGGTTAKGRKAIQTVNYFDTYKSNTLKAENNLNESGKNISLFETFMKSYDSLLSLKYPRNERELSGLPDDYRETERDAFNTAELWRKGTLISGDESGESGYDITGPNPNMVALFDGKVIEDGIGHDYNASRKGGDERPGSGYGNHVIIRSEDPKKPGTSFDALYAHFPDGELKVKDGDTIRAGQVLGRKATAAEFTNPATRKRVGSGNGPHQSVDFFPMGGPYVQTNPYPGWKQLRPFITGQLLGGGGRGKLFGHSARIIGNDLAFLAEVKRVANKFNIRESDLLGLMASESRFNPAEDNGTHVGLIQFSVDSARAVGTTQAALKSMNRAEQMKYVEKYLDYWKLPKGASSGQIYATVFAPSYASGDNNTILYTSPSAAYNSNAPLDDDGDGNITIREMGARLEKKKIEFGIPSNYKTTIKTKTSQQSNNLPPKSNKEISSSILKLLKQMGKSEVLYGQGNINVQIIDGKLVLKDTKGAFGTGLFGTEYKITGETNKTILLEIKKFLENKEKQSQSPSNSYSPLESTNYGGGNASVLILKETTIAKVSGPTRIVEVPVKQMIPFVIMPKSGSGMRNRSLIS